jgi:hypothetical protein
VEISVSDVVTMMRMAAMNAAKATSCTAVSRRWFMFTVFSGASIRGRGRGLLNNLVGGGEQRFGNGHA